MVFKKVSLRKESDMLLSFLSRYKREIAIIMVLLALIIFFIDIIIPAVVIITLGVISTFSTSYKRFIRMPPAFELITFTTVLVSLAYGPIVGAIYGAVVSFSAEIMTNALDVFIITFVPTRAIIGLTAGFLFDLFNGNILYTGFAASIMYNVIAQPLYIFMADVEMRLKSTYFFFLNIGFNFIIFALLGKVMVSLLRIN